jgi:hypothetical protein
MLGTDAQTGAPLEGVAHLRQSVADILSTPLGSRVMRRDYGSRLFELTDRPVNAGWIADAYAYTAEALDKWEPRFRLESVVLAEVNDEGRPVLDLSGIYLPDGQPITLEGIES